MHTVSSCGKPLAAACLSFLPRLKAVGIQKGHRMNLPCRQDDHLLQSHRPARFMNSYAPSAEILLAHDHQVRFDFEIDASLLADIYHHPLDRASERPGPIAWIIPCDRFATVAPNVEPLTCN